MKAVRSSPEQRAREFEPTLLPFPEIKEKITDFLLGLGVPRLKKLKKDIPQYHRLPKRVSLVSSDEIADRYGFVVSMSARIGENLAEVYSNLSYVKANQAAFEAEFFLKFGNEDSRKFVIESLRHMNKGWTDIEFQLLILESQKRVLEAAKVKYDGFAAVLSREITRRQSEFSQSSRNI